MRAGWILLGCLVVAACSEVPVTREPSDLTRIQDVRIRPDVLTITMSDGARCIAERPEEIKSGWSGVTDNCGYALPFTVTFFQGGRNPARFVVEEAFGVLDGEDILQPRAEAYIRDVNGVQKLFVSPLSNVTFGELPSS